MNTYSVTPTAGTGGSISPSTAQTVGHGSTTSFTVTPDAGYSVDGVSGCGGSLSGDSYTTGAVTGSCTVSASFRINTYSVTPSAGAGGSIVPSTVQTVNHGATTNFTLVPSTGYSINNVTGCGGSLVGGTYTTGVVTAACSISATFSINSYSISVSANPSSGGDVAGGGTYQHASDVTVTATSSNPEYSFVGWSENGSDVSDEAAYTFVASGDLALTADFIQNSEMLAGRYTGVMKSPLALFGADLTYTTFDISGEDVTITQEHFFGETCIFTGVFSSISVPMAASGTYQCSDFTSGAWSSTKIAKTARDAFIAELNIDPGVGAYTAQYNGFLQQDDVPDFYSDERNYIYDSGNYLDMAGSYVGYSKSADICAARSFEISSTNADVSIVGSDIEITEDSFFDGTCVFTGTIANSSEVPISAAGTYQCSNFDIGTWSSSHVALTGPDSFLADIQVDVPGRGCSYSVKVSGFK